MDLNEFHLMFKKESPLFQSKLLEDIIRTSLLEENVSYSSRSSFVGQQLVTASPGKVQNESESRKFTPSSETVATVRRDAQVAPSQQRNSPVDTSVYCTCKAKSRKPPESAVFSDSEKHEWSNGIKSSVRSSYNKSAIEADETSTSSSISPSPKGISSVNRGDVFQEARFNTYAGESCSDITETSRCLESRLEDDTTQTALAFHQQGSSSRLKVADTHINRTERKDERRERESGVGKTDTINNECQVSVPVEIGKVGEDEMVSIIKTIVQAQTCFRQCPNVDEQKGSIQQHEQDKSDLSDFREKAKDTFGTRQLLMDKIVKQFEQKIVETVWFAKRIPGFLKLTRDDQVSLIKASRNESDLISGMRRVNTANMIFNALDGQKFDLEDMKTLFPQELIDMFIEGGRKVAKLNATTEEQALIRAIVLTFSDRCELECREKVEDIQNRLVSCLLYVVRMRPVPFAVRIGQLFDFLVFCRKITDVALKTMKDILLESEKYSSNPMINEIM